MWNPKNPSVANVEKLKRKIDKLRKGTIVRLGGMTDCFQPIELDNRITYKIIKYLNKRRIGYLIVTKSSIVANDEYLKIYDKDLAHFQITVTTTDDSKSVKYEKATVPSKRIEAIEKLYKNGFDVQVRLSPFIYEYIDFDILNNIKCNKILIEFLRVNHWIKQGGDIFLQKTLFVDRKWNYHDLWREIFPIGVEMICKAVDLIEEGNIIKIPQDEKYATWEPSFTNTRLKRNELLQIGNGINI